MSVYVWNHTCGRDNRVKLLLVMGYLFDKYWFYAGICPYQGALVTC